jgi:hypothetical protein
VLHPLLNLELGPLSLAADLPPLGKRLGILLHPALTLADRDADLGGIEKAVASIRLRLCGWLSDQPSEEQLANCRVFDEKPLTNQSVV